MAKRISVNEGRSDTPRAGGRSVGRPAGLQLTTRIPTRKSLRSTIPPAREPTGGANEDVSWLRANRRAFPESFPVAAYSKHCPLQWRGRAGLTPASVSAFAISYALSLDGGGVRRNAQLNPPTLTAPR